MGKKKQKALEAKRKINLKKNPPQKKEVVAKAEEGDKPARQFRNNSRREGGDNRMEKGLPEGSTESANSAIVPRGDSTGKKAVKATTGLTDPAEEAAVVAAEAATGERENLTGSREMTRPRGGDTMKRTVLEPTTGVRQCPRTSS